MKRFRKILLDIDTGRGPGAALQRATMLARQNDATVTAVAVAPEMPRSSGLLVPDDLGEMLGGEREERLATTVAELQTAGVRVASKMLSGDHAVALIREVVGGGHDLLLRSHSTAAPYGPIDMKLLRKCPCRVWLVAGPAAGFYRKILAAVKANPDDASMNGLNSEVLDLATSLAASEGGEVLVVHGWSLFGEDVLRGRCQPAELSQLLEDTRSAARRELDAVVQPFAELVREDHIHLIKGLPGDVIPEFVASQDVDLLIMGTLARSGVAGLVTGNTAEDVLTKVRCSLIALKPPGFVSPITL